MIQVMIQFLILTIDYIMQIDKRWTFTIKNSRLLSFAKNGYFTTERLKNQEKCYNNFHN